jgi:hypothetical protein
MGLRVPESQWDIISLLERLDLFAAIETGQLALVSTRGAQSAGKIKNLPLKNGVTLYAFPQNDDAGRKWLGDIVSIAADCLVVPVPEEFNDLSDWVRLGKISATELASAIERAKSPGALHPGSQEANRSKEDAPADIHPLPERPAIFHPRDKYISEFAAQLGQILAKNDFYLFAAHPVHVRSQLVKDRKGIEHRIKKPMPISPVQFCTLIELYCRPLVASKKNEEKSQIDLPLTGRPHPLKRLVPG